MINFAHRGASGDYPENTMLAFKEAIKVGATGIELDVHKTKDGKLVVIHDEDIERTFKGRGLVKDFTLEELKIFNCRKALFSDHGECHVPTLEEVFKLVKKHPITLNIELKTDEIHYEGIESDVIELINNYQLKNQILISSFNPNSIKLCKEIDSQIKTGLLYYEPIDQVIEYAKSLKADAIHPDLRLVSEDLIKEAHVNGLEVNVYTVNSPIHMRKLISTKVDGIFTDHPALLNEIIRGVSSLHEVNV